MSVPFKVFSCSRCEFFATDLFLSGFFSYESSSGLFSVSRELGWCNECNDISPVEKIPTAQEIAASESEIYKKEEHVAHLQDSLEKKRSWFRKLFKISVRIPAEIQNLKIECEYLRTYMETDRKILLLLISRKSPPRCLKCGSTDCMLLPKIPYIPAPDYPLFSTEDPGPPIKIGFKHPSCNGELLVKYSDVWISFKKKHRIYDTEGLLIRSET